MKLNWVRCAALYPGCDVAEHGGSWKRMCVELTVRSSLETFQPLKSGAVVRMRGGTR